MQRRQLLTLSVMTAVAAILTVQPGLAQAPTGKVTVITSFSKDVTDPFKKAFEAAHPGTKLEVQNRNTVAGVRQLEETKANNQVDLFWASAPDAFEVMKAQASCCRSTSPPPRASPTRSAAIRSTIPTATISASRPPATASCGTSAT